MLIYYKVLHVEYSNEIVCDKILGGVMLETQCTDVRICDGQNVMGKLTVGRGRA